MGDSTEGFLDLSLANLESEHICCAIAGQQHQEGVERKKELLARGFGRGLVFRKLDVRGKVFIEYAPAESAWRPVVAPGYLVIHCLWVSGRYKGKGLGRDLLRHCLDRVGDRRGVVAVSGSRPYLTATRFYLHQGFERVERTDTGFDLVCWRSRGEAPTPRFGDNARRRTLYDAYRETLEARGECEARDQDTTCWPKLAISDLMVPMISCTCSAVITSG